MWRRAGILALVLLLAACGGGGGGSGASPSTTPSTTPDPGGSPAPLVPASCSLPDQQAWLLGYMRDQYLWYDRLGTPNAAAGTIDAYFQSLLYRTLDRFSYTQTTTQYAQFYADGTRTGYGYSLAFADISLTTLQVRMVEPGSPVELAGLRRGDTILQIDGFSPLQIAAGALSPVSAEGVARSFLVRTAAGVTRSFTVLSRNFALQPVQYDQVFDSATTGAGRVGYLNYGEFIDAGNPGLLRAFSLFAASGVTDLVLDLRYNGGGAVDVARNLASMIGGKGLAGQTFAQLRFNARHPDYNQSFVFTADAGVLPGPALAGLRRVFILASQSTASASELVINGLKPFMQVVLIGGTTYGKPYGFVPTEACGTVFNAVNFDSANALGVGGYVNGLSPTCAVDDDLGHALGDPAEAMLGAALYYARTGTCPSGTAAGDSLLTAAQVSTAPARPAVVGEQPAGMWWRRTP